MSYTPKSYRQIFQDYLINAYGVGLLGENSGFMDYVLGSNEDIENTIVLELAIHAAQVANFYDQLTIVRNEQNIALSNFNGLKIIGQMYLDLRLPDAAITELKIYIEEESDENIIISSGTAIQSKTNDNIIFYTMEDCVILVGQLETYVTARCGTVGPIGNVAAGDLDSFVGGADYGLNVINMYAATGGRKDETMEEYRSRLFSWKYILPKGTYDAIKNAIDDVAPVDSYYIEQYWDGYGTTRIIIDPPIQRVLNMVQNSIDNVKAIDEDILVVPVETIPIDLSCTINISIDQIVSPTNITKETTKTLVEQALKLYIDGGISTLGIIERGMSIGQDFVPFEAGMYIANNVPGVKNVTFDFPSDPVEILSHERGTSGEITVAVV